MSITIANLNADMVLLMIIGFVSLLGMAVYDIKLLVCRAARMSKGVFKWTDAIKTPIEIGYLWIFSNFAIRVIENVTINF